MPSDAWELMRGSALKVMRALQTLGKLTAQLGSDINKHRSEPLANCQSLKGHHACFCLLPGSIVVNLRCALNAGCQSRNDSHRCTAVGLLMDPW